MADHKTPIAPNKRSLSFPHWDGFGWPEIL